MNCNTCVCPLPDPAVPLLRRLRDSLPEPFIDLPRYLDDLSGGPVGFLWFGPSIRLRIADAPLAREVLVTHSYDFPKSDAMRTILGPILGHHSMLLSEGDVHKRHRRIVSSAFHFDALQSLIPLIWGCAATAVDSWLSTGTAAPPEAEGVDGGGWVELEANRLLSAVTLSSEYPRLCGEICSVL